MLQEEGELLIDDELLESDAGELGGLAEESDELPVESEDEDEEGSDRLGERVGTE